MDPKKRLEELRAVLRNEDISYGELAELQELIPYIEAGDVELLEAAGVAEFEDDKQMDESQRKIAESFVLSFSVCDKDHIADYSDFELLDIIADTCQEILNRRPKK